VPDQPPEPRRTGKAGLQLGSVGLVGCLAFSVLIAVVVVVLYLVIRALT
jgi:type IV secretory pathway VirB3-like protein